MKEARIRPVCAVSIATSDSGGGAGIQADLLTFAAHRVYGATILVAATAQNTTGIAAIYKLPMDFLVEQIDAVFSDFKPQAVKIGALLDAPRIRAVAAGLKRWRAKNVVLDPVIEAKSGTPLLSRDALASVKRYLLPLCDLATPNIPEAEAISGLRIRTDTDRREAARSIASLGAKAVLITGGHASGQDVTDLLFDGKRDLPIEHPRIATRATHGTGCTLSSAIAANLALGHDLHRSVRLAIRYVRAGLKRGVYPGRGWGVGDHFALQRVP